MNTAPSYAAKVKGAQNSKKKPTKPPPLPSYADAQKTFKRFEHPMSNSALAALKHATAPNPHVRCQLFISPTKQHEILSENSHLVMDELFKKNKSKPFSRVCPPYSL